MINQKALEKVICRIVAAVTPLPEDHIIAGDSNTGAPDSSYCEVRLENPGLIGQAMKSSSTAPALDRPDLVDIIDRTATQMMLSFSVNFYRDNALSYAAALLQANKRIPVQGILRLAGMGWSSAGPVNNLSELFSGNIEQRAQLNVRVFAQDVVDDRVNRIYQVEYAVSDESETTLAQGNVNGLPS